LNVIFSIVGVAMMFACIFTVGASVGFDFKYQPDNKPDTVSSMDIRLMFELCFGVLVLFELVLLKFKKHCEVCGV